MYLSDYSTACRPWAEKYKIMSHQALFSHSFGARMAIFLGQSVSFSMAFFQSYILVKAETSQQFLAVGP